MKNPMRKPVRRAIFDWMARRHEAGQAWDDLEAFRSEHPGLAFTLDDWNATRRSFQHALEKEHEWWVLAQALRCPFCGGRDLGLIGEWFDGPSCYECLQGPEAAVVCYTCGAQGPDVENACDYEDPAMEAVRRWNSRGAC